MCGNQEDSTFPTHFPSPFAVHYDWSPKPVPWPHYLVCALLGAPWELSAHCGPSCRLSGQQLTLFTEFHVEFVNIQG